MPELSIMQRLLRERVLSRYVAALERGDLDTLASIMQRAEHDAALETMIFELHATYQSEEDFLKLVQEEHEMDFKEGVHKSVKGDEISASEPGSLLASTPVPARRKPARWITTLVAILIVCVVAGGFLAAHIWHSGQAGLASRNATATPAPWCVASANMTPPGYLSSISGLAENDVWAIESRGVEYGKGIAILHWDGVRWNVALQSGESRGFNRIVEIAPDNVWVVGWRYSGKSTSTSNPASITLTMHWDGTQWQTIASPNGPTANNTLVAISAASANDIWAVGNFSTSNMLVIHWDGQHWSSIANPTKGKFNIVQLTSIKAFSADDVWMAGNTLDYKNNTVILHWDGAQWKTLANPPELSGIGGSFQTTLDGATPDDIWAVSSVGNGVMIEHWNGKQWKLSTPLPLTPDNNDALASVVAAGSDNAWTVGRLGTSSQGFRPTIEHWNGHQWQVVPGPALSGGLGEVTMIGNQPWAAGFLGSVKDNPSKPLLEMPCK